MLPTPLREGAPWWPQAYSKPDVGLNHPARWTWTNSTQTASFNLRDPNQLNEDDPFYQMKGFFITPAGSPDNSPQRSRAAAGDQLKLRVRVYNFSLADMPSTTKIHVRFYGQEFENSLLTGFAFLIGEDVIAPLPGFNSASNNGELPNWEFASTTFDTTNYANQKLVFWVVAWMADDATGWSSSGELEGHGLTADPGQLSFTQITDVPAEAYSNNVGLYGTYSPFFIAPQISGASASSNRTPLLEATAGNLSSTGRRNLQINVVGPAVVEKRIKVQVTIHNTSAGELQEVPVVLYDGDPSAGGKAIDVQRITFMAKGEVYTLRTFFVPQTPGRHRLFARFGRASADPILTSKEIHVFRRLR